MTAQNHVYFLQNPNSGEIKIGTSRDLFTRMKDLRRETGEPLMLLGYIEGDATKEAEIHKKFVHHNVGREWFAPSLDIIEFARAQTLPLNEVQPQDREVSPAWQSLLWTLKAMPIDEIVRHTGCSTKTAYNWQNGKSIPNADHVTALLRGSDVFADAFLDVTGRRKPGMTQVQRGLLLKVIGEQ